MGLSCACLRGSFSPTIDLEDLKKNGGLYVMVREAAGLPDAFAFTCRIGRRGTSYEEKDIASERFAHRVSTGTAFNFTVLYLRSQIPQNAELHFHFYSRYDIATGCKLLGEAKALVQELEVLPDRFQSFPIAGTKGKVVLMCGTKAQTLGKEALMKMLSQDESSLGGSFSQLNMLLASASQFGEATEDQITCELTLLSLGAASMMGPFSMREWFLSRSKNEQGEDTYMWNGPKKEDCVCYSGHADVTKRLQELGEKLGTNNIDGTAYRANSLGITPFFSGAIWPELAPNGRIGLGQNQENHARFRKIIVKAVGDEGEGRWTTASIKEFTSSFWKGRTSLTVADDIWVWSQQMLHKFVLGLDITTEDAAAFSDMQQKLLLGTCAPLPLFSVMGIDKAVDQKVERLHRYKAALKALWPEEKLTEEELTVVTSIHIDALLFAGGFSIPIMTSYLFGVLYSDYGREGLGPDFKLRKSILKRFVLEVCRRHAPVNGFCWVEKSEGFAQPDKTVYVNLLMASRDPRVWGEDSDKFRIRPLEDYHKSVAWAEPAMAPLNSSPNSHACPAKQMSIVVLTEFLAAWMIENIGQEAFDRDEPFDPASWKASPDPAVVNEIRVEKLTISK